MSTATAMFEMLLDISHAAQQLGPHYGPPRSSLSQKKFDESTEKIRSKRYHSPEHVEFLLLHELHKKALGGIKQALGLERCAVLRPFPARTGFWSVVDEIGIPQCILEKSYYSKGEGLTGKVLAGRIIESENILQDARRSRRYGDQWIDENGKQCDEASDRSFIGVPLWMQQSEAETEAVGALIAIRVRDSFSDDEKQCVTLVARILSFAHDRLRSWRKRAETDVRHLRLGQIWQAPLSDSSRYSEVLRILQQEFPFPRMLLSLADESQGRMRGVAATGFRSDIVSETNRPLSHVHDRSRTSAPFPSAEKQDDDRENPMEDVLAWVYRKQSSLPRIVSPNDRLWAKVNEITAFRHQVRNSLLLVPLMASGGGVLGVLLAELPNSYDLTPNEVNRISMFLNHTAHLIESHRQRLTGRMENGVWRDIHATLFASIRGESSQDAIDPVANLLSKLCMHMQIEAGIVFEVYENDRVLRGTAAVGVTEQQLRQHMVALDSEPALADRLPIAAAALKRRRAITRIKSDLFDKLGRSGDISVPDCFNSCTGTFITAIPIAGPEGFNGVLVYVDRRLNTVRGSQESITRFTSALGHSLSLSQLSGRIEKAERSATAFQSLAFAISEIGRRDFEFKQESGGSVAIRSVLRDTAAMFDAALAQLFLLESPLQATSLPEEGLTETLHGKRLCSVAQFLLTKDSVPRHFAGRFLKDAAMHRPDITIGREKGLTVSALTSLAPVVSSDVETDPFWSSTKRELTGCRSFVGVPLLAESDKGIVVYGVLTLTRLRIDREDSRAFGVDEVNAVQNVAALIVSALVKAQRVSEAENQTKQVQTQVQRYLKWFRHDIPSLIMYLEREVQKYAKNEVSADRIGLLANGIKVIYMACADGLSDSGSDFSEGQRGELFTDIDELEGQVRVLLDADWYGKTVIHRFDVKGDRKFKGEFQFALTYATYALVHNAVTAFAYNQPEGVEHGNVFVRWVVGRQEVTLEVQDDGGGLKGATLTDITREGRSMWATASKAQPPKDKHFGMGLYIVKRLITACGGELSAKDAKDSAGRVGALFCVRIPFSGATDVKNSPI